MRRRGGWIGILVLTLLLTPGRSLLAQDEPPEQAQEETIAVFLDCQYYVGCDPTFFRTEANFVNWVLDRQAADVHLLVTGQGTGGGGAQINLDFIGLREFEGDDARLTHTSSGDATQDEVRRDLIEVIKRGFMRYLAGRPVAERVMVTYQAPDAAPGGPPGGPRGGTPGSGIQVDDPWDFWVFTTSVRGSFNGESIVSSSSANGSLSARRTTEDWKLSFGVSGSHSQTDYEIGDVTESSIRKSWSVSSLVAKSMTDHWTLGARMTGGGNTYSNQRLRLRVAPGIEYNLFPYEESTRRELLLLYSIGLTHWDYEAITIFGEVEETRVDHSVTAQLNLQQPWGQASIFSEAGHYFHDTSLWTASVGGNMNVRLFKGFSFNVFGSYSWIRNQLDLEAGDASDVDILTRRRQLATSFSYYTSFGISYRFGSIFNNVVNPRFGGGGGGIMIMY